MGAFSDAFMNIMYLYIFFLLVTKCSIFLWFSCKLFISCLFYFLLLFYIFSDLYIFHLSFSMSAVSHIVLCHFFPVSFLSLKFSCLNPTLQYRLEKSKTLPSPYPLKGKGKGISYPRDTPLKGRKSPPQFVRLLTPFYFSKHYIFFSIKSMHLINLVSSINQLLG